MHEVRPKESECGQGVLCCHAVLLVLFQLISGLGVNVRLPEKSRSSLSDWEEVHRSACWSSLSVGISDWRWLPDIEVQTEYWPLVSPYNFSWIGLLTTHTCCHSCTTWANGDGCMRSVSFRILGSSAAHLCIGSLKEQNPYFSTRSER